MAVEVEQIVREYIDKSLHMSLATVSGDKPWVCEVHFAYDGQLNLYFRSLASRRHSQEIAANPHVAGNIVRQHKLEDYPHAIYFEGLAELISDEAELIESCEHFKERGIANDSAVAEAQKEDGHKFYKITVENWYAFGKFGGDSGQKYKLKWNGGEK